MTTVSRTTALLNILRDQVRIHDDAKNGVLDIFGDVIVARPLSDVAINAIRIHLAEIDAGRDAIDMTDSLEPSKY